MDLKKMRNTQWRKHWKAVAEDLLRNISHTALADQVSGFF